VQSSNKYELVSDGIVDDQKDSARGAVRSKYGGSKFVIMELNYDYSFLMYTCLENRTTNTYRDAAVIGSRGKKLDHYEADRLKSKLNKQLGDKALNMIPIRQTDCN